MATEQELCREYDAWCAEQKLPHISADELICEDVTDAQRAWLRDFISRWEEATAP